MEKGKKDVEMENGKAGGPSANKRFAIGVLCRHPPSFALIFSPPCTLCCFVLVPDIQMQPVPFKLPPRVHPVPQEMHSSHKVSAPVNASWPLSWPFKHHQQLIATPFVCVCVCVRVCVCACVCACVGAHACLSPVHPSVAYAHSLPTPSLTYAHSLPTLSCWRCRRSKTKRRPARNATKRMTPTFPAVTSSVVDGDGSDATTFGLRTHATIEEEDAPASSTPKSRTLRLTTDDAGGGGGGGDEDDDEEDEVEVVNSSDEGPINSSDEEGYVQMEECFARLHRICLQVTHTHTSNCTRTHAHMHAHAFTCIHAHAQMLLQKRR